MRNAVALLVRENYIISSSIYRLNYFTPERPAFRFPFPFYSRFLYTIPCTPQGHKVGISLRLLRSQPP